MVIFAWVALTVTFWVGAGIAAADGLAGAAFAYAVFPFAVAGPVGVIAEDLDKG